MEWYEKTGEEIRAEINPRGLSTREAEQIRSRVGRNEWTVEKKTPLLLQFFRQWKDFMVLTLLCAAVVSAAASWLKGELSLVDPLVILSIITFNAILGVAQEVRAEKSLEALRRLSAPTATVYRDGKVGVCPAAELVPGDIIRLESGNYVPADGRLIEAVDLRTEESALTGESLPVEKDANWVGKAPVSVADRRNMVMAATLVVRGRGRVLVTATGLQTEAGKIACQMMKEVPPPTPLQKRLEETGKKLGVGALLVCAVVFAVGALRHFPLFDMFMVSVSLAVAAIPEGLSAVVTMMLSIGVRRMVQCHAVVRRLPVVETLGCATFICSDKTGTLTQNRMRVREMWSPGTWSEETKKKMLTLAALCSDAAIIDGNGQGEATEKALVEAAWQAGIVKSDWESRCPRSGELPFDSARKRMTTVHRGLWGQDVAITKGAPEILLTHCDFFWDGRQQNTLQENMRRRIEKQCGEMADRGLRVIAVARREWSPELVREKWDRQLTFFGLIGLMDPPRPEAREAIEVCARAGIRTVMITGDHVRTAQAVARELGILEEGGLVVTGAELENWTEAVLREKAEQVRVYARVSPEHKVRVVRALQASGQVVAMTGDGVNDAPALKAADIGCAMGLTGTDVARNTADMVLTDDNFATIVSAVREGRIVYDNIRKAIHFLLATNVGEMVAIFAAVMLGLPSPLLAVQLLWVNLVTDSLPAVALGLEPGEEGLMHRQPISKEKSMFADHLGWEITLEGLLIGGLTLCAFWWGCRDGGLSVGRTLAFGTLSLTELCHGMNMRSQAPLFRIGFFTNPVMVLAMVLCVGLQILVMVVPPIAAVFHVVPLSLKQWCFLLGWSTLPIVILEIQKVFRYKNNL